MAFPVLSKKPSQIKLKTLIPLHKKESESNYIIQRRKGTKVVKEWSIIYGKENLLSETDKDLIMDYFESNAGSSFDWLNIRDGNTYVVFFADEELEPTEHHLNMGYYELTFSLREV